MSRKHLVSGVAAVGLAAVLFAGTAAQASAFHCYVANKPAGAGAHVSVADIEGGIREAGKSGNLVVQGAFLSLSAIDPELPDVFLRGQPVPGEDEVRGLGSLPEKDHPVHEGRSTGPHHNGGPNGVQELEFPDEPED